MLIPGLTVATLELTMPGCLLYLHLRAPKTTTTMEERVESLAEERVESLAEERVERAMPMATTTTMTTMMMMIMVLGTLLTVLGLIPTAHIALSAGMTIGDHQVAQAKNAKASTITTMDIGSTFLALSLHHHHHQPKEERPRVASLAPKVERAMPTATTTMMTTMMMMTIGMVAAMVTLVEVDTTALDMDRATTLDMAVMMIGVTLDVAMTIGATLVLTRLGRKDQDIGLAVGRSQRMCPLLPIQASQGRPRVARPREARQRKAERWLRGNYLCPPTAI